MGTSQLHPQSSFRAMLAWKKQRLLCKEYYPRLSDLSAASDPIQNLSSVLFWPLSDHESPWSQEHCVQQFSHRLRRPRLPPSWWEAPGWQLHQPLWQIQVFHWRDDPRFVQGRPSKRATLHLNSRLVCCVPSDLLYVFFFLILGVERCALAIFQPYWSSQVRKNWRRPPGHPKQSDALCCPGIQFLCYSISCTKIFSVYLFNFFHLLSLSGGCGAQKTSEHLREWLWHSRWDRCVGLSIIQTLKWTFPQGRCEYIVHQFFWNQDFLSFHLKPGLSNFSKTGTFASCTFKKKS